MSEQIIERMYPASSQDRYIEKYNKFSEWQDFLEQYRLVFKDYWGWIKIERSIFKRINELMLAIQAISLNNSASIKHKPFVFALYLLLNEVSRDRPAVLSIEDVKEMLGFARETNSIDYLIKEDGELDRFGMTGTKTVGVKRRIYVLNSKAKSAKVKYLKKVYKIKHHGIGNFVILQAEVFVYMLFHIHEIRVQGVFLYCYMLTKCLNDKNEYKLTTLSMNKIVEETGLSKNTAYKYLAILEKYGLIEIREGEFHFDDEDFFESKEINQYLIITNLNDKCVFSHTDRCKANGQTQCEA